MEMHRMPDGSWMPGVDHEHAMHKMSDGSWMRGVSHSDAIADTSVPTNMLVGEVQMHQMPDGSWMPGLDHEHAVHKMSDGSWMPGMTHEAAQAMELTAKEQVQSNPAAAAGVSVGPIVNPKSLANVLSPKTKAAKAVAPAHKLGVSTAAAVDVVKAKVRKAARHAAKQAAKKAV